MRALGPNTQCIHYRHVYDMSWWVIITTCWSRQYGFNLENTFSWDPGGDWTWDLSISSRPLCHLSYRALLIILTSKQRAKHQFAVWNMQHMGSPPSYIHCHPALKPMFWPVLLSYYRYNSSYKCFHCKMVRVVSLVVCFHQTDQGKPSTRRNFLNTNWIYFVKTVPVKLMLS